MRQPVDRYVDRLVGRRRPKPFAPTEDELAVMRTAIDLAAAGPDAAEPSPAFVDRLRERLREHEQAEAAAPEPRPAWRTPPRRRLLAAGSLTATGVLAGMATDQLFLQSGTGAVAEQPPASPGELVPVAGSWQQIARTAQVPEGAVVAFDLGSLTGFVRRAGGRVQAVTGTCTHQGCRLDLDNTHEVLACPCHGATFSFAGVNLTRPRSSGGPLPPLPRLPVREAGGSIEVYAPLPGRTPPAGA